MNKNFLIGVLIVLLIAGIGVESYFLGKSAFTLGSTSPNMHSLIGTSSTIVVGTTSNETVFSSNELCASRIITTVERGIMLSFTSSNPATVLTGHYQAASTTKEYESGIYGCGTWTAYGHNASSTITISEFRF